MSNPLVNQGTLSRLRASVNWPLFPQLNVTPSFLNREGIRLAFEGEATRFLPTLTGVVTSPEPYQMISLTLNLLKTQSLAALYEAQLAAISTIGPGVVRPDVGAGGIVPFTPTSGLQPFDLFNCAIMNVRELNFSGEDAGYSVTIGGYVLRNLSLWI